MKHSYQQYQLLLNNNQHNKNKKIIYEFNSVKNSDLKQLKKDGFNSLSLLFKIVGDKNLTQLNLIETYSVLTILKNLGLENEYKQLASRILL